MPTVHHHALNLVDKLVAARAASNSPADILTAINGALDELVAKRDEIAAEVPPSPDEPQPYDDTTDAAIGEAATAASYAPAKEA